MANTGVIWQQAAHTTYHYLLAVQKEPHKKASLLTKDTEEFSGRRAKGGLESGEWTIQ